MTTFSPNDTFSLACTSLRMYKDAWKDTTIKLKCTSIEFRIYILEVRKLCACVCSDKFATSFSKVGCGNNVGHEEVEREDGEGEMDWHCLLWVWVVASSADCAFGRVEILRRICVLCSLIRIVIRDAQISASNDKHADENYTAPSLCSPFQTHTHTQLHCSSSFTENV